jgi:hypothetical protein
VPAVQGAQEAADATGPVAEVAEVVKLPPGHGEHVTSATGEPVSAK